MLKKVSCEICKCDDVNTLHYHHIIPRTEVECTNKWSNICIICSNCHNLYHAGEIKIIGIYPSTQMPYKRTLIYEKDGKRNLDIDEPYLVEKPNAMRLPNG